MKRYLLLGHLTTLVLGGMLYLSFRSDTLVMFSWLDKINLLEPISELRLITLPFLDNLPNWFLYSLPDGLWLFSYLCVLLVIWDNRISKQNIQWFLLVPLLAMFSEIGQIFGIVPGTFDIIDLLFYFGGAVLPVLIYTNLNTITYYEKNN